MGHERTRARALGRLVISAVALAVLAGSAKAEAQSPLVFQSDFGTRDGAVAAMKGVAASVDENLPVFDLTHEIPTYDIWRAAYRLRQSAEYWPRGTVFVSVVDPGVGTDRKSVVLETETGHFFVTPDNGTLTLVADHLGVAGLREIDETENRLGGSTESHTFHGRDVYAYTGARLAAGVITFGEVGPALPPRVVRLDYQEPAIRDDVLQGMVPVLDVRFGNVWTNIGSELLERFGVEDGKRFQVTIEHEGVVVHRDVLPFARTFGAVGLGEPLLYLNSLGNLAIGLNQASFADAHGIEAGPGWEVRLSPVGDGTLDDSPAGS